MKHLILVGVALAVFFGCKKEEKSETSSCSCFEMTSPRLDIATSNISGVVKLSPPPFERIESKVFISIDEKHIFSDERHRILEQEVHVAYQSDDIGVCDTTGIFRWKNNPGNEDFRNAAAINGELS